MLVAGTRYYVTFYVSLADSGKYACNDIGAYFSTDSLNFWGTSRIVRPYTPQVANNPTQNPLTDKVNWTKVSGSFVAQGGEKYIIIGNFKDDAHSDTVFVNSASHYSYPWSYYYIDDVIVSPDSTYADSLFAGVNEVNLQTKNAKVYPNPANTVLHVDMIQKVQDVNNSFCLYNATGQRVKCVTFNTNNNTLAIGTLPTGLYYYRLKDNTGKVLKTGKLTIVH